MLQLHVQAKDCLLKTIGEDAKRLVSDAVAHSAKNVDYCMASKTLLTPQIMEFSIFLRLPKYIFLKLRVDMIPVR